MFKKYVCKQPPKLTQIEKAQILSRMSQLLAQDYSLMQTLEIILASSTRKQNYWLKKITITLEQGKSVAEGFRSALFSEYVNIMVAQAEWHGNMAMALQQASIWKDRKLQMKREWQKVIFYPAILLSVLMLILYLIFYLVIPQFLVMFQSFSVDLPVLTLKTLLFFQWWQDNYLWVFSLLILGLVLVYLAIRLPQIRHKLIEKLLVLPETKSILQDYFTILFTLQLGSLVQANIPLEQGLRKVKEGSASLYLQNRVEKLEEKILRGESLAQVIKAELMFSAELYPVIYYAELNGQLGQQLVHFGMLLERELMDTWLKRIKLLEPVLLIGIGLFIAYLFFSLFAPILEMIKVI